MAAFGFLIILAGLFVLFNALNGNLSALVQGKAQLKAQPAPSAPKVQANSSTLSALGNFAYPGGTTNPPNDGSVQPSIPWSA